MNFQSKDDEAGKRIALTEERDVMRIGKQNVSTVVGRKELWAKSTEQVTLSNQ